MKYMMIPVYILALVGAAFAGTYVWAKWIGKKEVKFGSPDKAV
jgi:hypothetical protein